MAAIHWRELGPDAGLGIGNYDEMLDESPRFLPPPASDAGYKHVSSELIAYWNLATATIFGAHDPGT